MITVKKEEQPEVSQTTLELPASIIKTPLSVNMFTTISAFGDKQNALPMMTAIVRLPKEERSPDDLTYLA